MGRLRRVFSLGNTSEKRRDTGTGPSHKRSKSTRESMSALLSVVGLANRDPKIRQRRGGRGITLIDMPDEIILCIIDYMRVGLPRFSKEERFDGQERRRYLSKTKDLVALSKTCRRLQPIAQQALLHTVVLGGFDDLPAIISLVRLLFQRPELHRYIRRLRIGLPPDKKYYLPVAGSATQRMNQIPYGPPPSDIWFSAAEVIAHSALPSRLKQEWQDQLSDNHPRPLCGVLLALVPRLQYLSVAHSLGGVSGDQVLRQMFGTQSRNCVAELRSLPVFRNLRYFNNKTPARLRPRLSPSLQRMR